MGNFARENVNAEALSWVPTEQPIVASNGYMWWDNDGNLYIIVNGKKVLITGGGSGSGTGTTALNVKSAPYNAKGNGQTTLSSITITSGSPILTASFDSFTPSMVGQPILVQAAGAGGVDLYTTVLSYQSATQVTLATNALFTVTTDLDATFVVGGTDDTAAIQAAINAAAAAIPPVGVYIPAGVYLISATLTFPGSGGIPTSVIGDGSESTILVRSQAFASSASPLIDFNAGERSCDIGRFGVIGASLASAASPTVGYEVAFEHFSSSQIYEIACYRTRFQNGIYAYITNGTISALLDVSQSQIALDNGVILSSQAGSFLFTQNGLGGYAIDCLSIGYLDPLSPRTDAGFSYTGQSNFIGVVFQDCICAGNVGVETGFNLTGVAHCPVTLIGCIAEGCTTVGFLTNGYVTMQSCIGFNNTLDLQNTGVNLQIGPGCWFGTITSSASPIFQTNLTAALGSTNVFTLPSDAVGLFNVSYYIECTTAATSGHIIPALAWTDEVGARSLNGSSLDVSATNYVQGSIVIKAAANTTVNFSTSFSSVVGTPHYNVYVAVNKII
jgi:hypothetical protein